MLKLLKSNILLIIILFTAAFLRLYKIGDYMTFLGDEGRDVLVVYNILHGKFTLLGPTSSVGGFFLGPIYYYFMAPFLWLFNYDPVGPAVMVGLFGVLTVYLIYRIGNEFFDKKAGLVAASLYAISPLVIAYSRSSWNPNLMPFFSLLTLYVLYKGVKSNTLYLFGVVGVLLGILMQLHYLSLFVGVIVGVYIFFTQRNIVKTIPKYLLVFGGFLVGWSPFLAFEARHGFLNIQSIIKFIFVSPAVGGASGNYVMTAWNVLFRLFARLVTKYPPPEQVSARAHVDIAVWYYLTIVLLVVSLGIFLYQYRKIFQEKSEKWFSRSLILVWLLVGVLMFGFYKKSIYDYYFGFMFPLPFLLVGNAFSFLWNKKSLKVFIIVAFSVLVYINYTGMPFLSLPNRQKEQVKQIAQFVLSKTDNKPYNFALLTLGNSDHGYRYFLKLAGKDPVMIETLINDPQRKTVTDQLLVVCEDTACQPRGAAVWEVAGFGRAEIVEEWNVSVVKVYKLEHYKGK